MLSGKSLRAFAWIGVSAFLLCAPGSDLSAQSPAACKGPAELEKVIAAHPSAGAYDALGAYFGQRQQLSCAIAAFQSAAHLEPNSWEARFNLSLAYLQTQQPAKAVRELKIALSLKPTDPMAHTALGVALSELDQNDAAIEQF